MVTKRLSVWLISLIMAVVVTYIIFEYTPIAIPFFEGGVFTVLTVVLMMYFFTIPVDAVLKAGVYGADGIHYGIFDTVGPITPDDPAPTAEKDYQPIVSRDERAKRAGKLLKAPPKH